MSKESVADEERAIRGHIAEDPHWLDPADARITGYGAPVWALIGYLRAVDGDLARTARDYGVPEEAVRAAEAYYQRHREAIDARLTENAAATA